MSITQTINLERDYLMAEEKLSAIYNYYYQDQIKLFQIIHFQMCFLVLIKIYVYSPLK